MLKKDIRASYLAKRNALSMADVAILNRQLLAQFQKHVTCKPDVIHRYMPAVGRKEPDPGPMVDWLTQLNPALSQMVPRVVPGTQEMVCVKLAMHMQWIENRWGIPEPAGGALGDPATVDLVFIPLLAFDATGQRVGYGKGFYDRFLTTCKQDCLRLGLSWFGPVDVIDDTGPHDIPLHICITPEKAFFF